LPGPGGPQGLNHGAEKVEKAVADDLRSIYYTASKQKALEFFDRFKYHRGEGVPSAVASLERSINSGLTFFQFPEVERLSLRTPNSIARLSKEFKRRSQPMEIVAGELSCYRLPAFIALKMELHWGSIPIGKIRKNLPLFKELNEFTQKP
jgi:putative transposase